MFNGTYFLLNQRCIIERRSDTSTNSMNEIVLGTYAPIYSNIRCRLTSNTGAEKHDEEWITVEKQMMLLPYNTDVNIDDQIRIGNDVYSIEYIDPNVNSGNHHMDITLKRISGIS